jgi:IS605 OrfB family transposase
MAGTAVASCTAAARVLVRGGADERTGEALAAAVVAKRAGWCAALVRGMTARLVAARWNAPDVAALASGLGPDGRPLPPQAWMAVRRLGWDTAPPKGVVVNDRITRMAQEQAGRLLRTAAWRAALTAGITATWPADPGKRTPAEWDAVRAAVPGGEHVVSGIIRARTRQVQRFTASEGRLPCDVFDLEGPPRAAGMLLLCACDRQQATLRRHGTDPRRALLRVQLPTRPDPRSYRDWSWVAVPLALPPTVPAAAALHLPVLRAEGGKARAEVAFTRAVPAARRDGHVIAIGADWGLNTLLSAGPARLNGDGTVTALGAGAQYRAAGILAKARRLRRHSERLHAKISHYERLTAGRDGHPLAARLEVLRDEARHVAGRRTRLNGALAWSAARWTADQALAAGATVIYIEDLRTLEARGMGKTLNTRLSQTVRGQIADRLRHLAAEHGIAVVTVPPRGTSRNCPRCLAPLRHSKAPDQPGVPGWKWARCPGCGWQGDRDTGAWQRIAARGLTHQPETAIDRKTGAMSVRAVDDALEPRALTAPYASRDDRSKAGPTRGRTACRAPRRRTAPPAPRPPGRRAQRPGGHATTARPLPRAATRDQGATTNGFTPAPRPHRARGAALGAGFHLHAHATPPRDPTLSSPQPQGPLRITKPIRDAHDQPAAPQARRPARHRDHRPGRRPDLRLP